MLIFDEISMIFSRLFSKISKKLNYLKGYYNSENIYFGQIFIIIVLGDFAQFLFINTISVIFSIKKKKSTATDFIENNSEINDAILQNVITVTE